MSAVLQRVPLRGEEPQLELAVPRRQWHRLLPFARRAAIALPFPLALLALWQVAASQQWIPSQILPPPLVVASTFDELWSSGELQQHLLVSLQRVLIGFGIGTALGLLAGAAMGFSEWVEDLLYPSFRAIAQVPSLGWLPLLMLLVGIDEALKIILIAKAAFVPVTLATVQGIRQVPAACLDVAKLYRFSAWQRWTRVVLPAAFPPIWGGVRYGLTHAWLALVAVELLASSEGLGYLVVYGRQLYQLDVVLCAVVIVGAVGFALDQALALAEMRLLRWRREGV
jgi:sulfonate transport system permease protein